MVRILNSECAVLQYGNDRMVFDYVKDDCCPGSSGSSEPLVIPQGMFKAASKAAANILAEDYALEVGQRTANMNGTCEDGPAFAAAVIDLGSSGIAQVSTNLVSHNGFCGSQNFILGTTYNASATKDSSNNVTISRSPSDFVGKAVVEYDRYCDGDLVGTGKIVVNFTYSQSCSSFAKSKCC